MHSSGLTPFWRGILALGLLVAGLRAANIAYVLHGSQRDGIEYYVTPDTVSYLLNSEAMFDERPMSPLFRERIGYPFLMALARGAGVGVRHLMWLTVPLEVPAVLSMALLGWALTRRKAVAGLAAVLYALNPNGFQGSALLIPDWLNGQFMLMAIALAMDWALNGRRWSGWAACVLLPVSQMLRPTLFAVAVPLVCLLAKGFWIRERRGMNILLVVAALAYPAVNVAVNAVFYGVPTLMLSSGFQLHACFVSHVRAQERNAEKPDSMTRLYMEEKHLVQLADPREQILNPFGHTPIADNFAEVYEDVVKTSNAYLRERMGWWILSGLGGLRYQLSLAPSLNGGLSAEQTERFWQLMEGQEGAVSGPAATALYPRFSGVMSKLHKLALFFSLCGVMLTIRRLPVGVTMFYAGCTAIIAMACAAAWYDTVRVRLLVDLIYTPILAVGLLSVPAWIGFASLTMIAYGPRKLFGWSNAYMQGASAVVTLVTAAVLAWRSGSEDGGEGDPTYRR